MKKTFLAIFLSAGLNQLYAQVPTVQDCQGAIPVFDSVIVIASSFAGSGNFPNEINTGLSCLNQGEKNDVWLYLDICSPGPFGFTIDPVTPNDDYDWAVYNLTNATCADIYNNYQLEISCNFSGVSGPTGCNGLTGPEYNPLLNVFAGEHLLINISNFSSTQGGFTIHFVNPNKKCSGGLIRGAVFHDIDSDCVQLPSEYGLKNRLVGLNPGNMFAFTNNAGVFSFLVNPASYTLSLPNAGNQNIVCPSSGNYSINILNTGDSSLDNNFASRGPDSLLDLKIVMSCAGVRLNQNSNIFLSAGNYSTDTSNAIVSITIDSLVNYNYTSVPYDSVNDHTYYWSLSEIPPLAVRTIAVGVICPLSVPIATPLQFTSCIYPVASDSIPLNNFDTLDVITVNAIDPNLIAVEPIGTGAQHAISQNQLLTYTIYFQNVGNAPANNVLVDNVLDNALDISTLNLISSSHNFNAQFLPNRRLRFLFGNIQLPDSTTNEPGSHGFVKYSISPNPGVALGTVINNSASIIFDQNLPVITNTVFNTVLNSSPVVAGLSSSDTLFCANNCISFFDMSLNNPTSWQWYFPGATPGSSTLQNPTNICYANTGNYSVKLVACNAMGCDSLTLGDYIHAETLPIVSLGNDTSICIGSSVILDAGSGFNSYLWSNNATTQTITVSTPGFYSVKIGSGNCFGRDTILVANKTCSPTVSFSTPDTAFCQNSCISFFDLSANFPTSWQWYFPGGNPSTSTIQNPTNICYAVSGTYDVAFVACNTAGCDSVHFTNLISCFQNPVASIYTSNDTLYSVPAFSYQWYENTSGLIAGATNQYLIASQPGSYYCVVSDSVGCTSTSNSIVATSLNEHSNAGTQFLIQPNPNNGGFEILLSDELKNKNFELRIVDAIGKVVFISQLLTRNLQLNLEEGIYFLHLLAVDKSIGQKFIVKKN